MAEREHLLARLVDWAAECDRQAGVVRELERRVREAKMEIKGAMLQAIDKPAVWQGLQRALTILEGAGEQQRRMGD